MLQYYERSAVHYVYTINNLYSSQNTHMKTLLKVFADYNILNFNPHNLAQNIKPVSYYSNSEWYSFKPYDTHKRQRQDTSLPIMK